eukprot:6208731-Pleurochrysis_carterae.AAC.1
MPCPGTNKEQKNRKLAKTKEYLWPNKHAPTATATATATATETQGEREEESKCKWKCEGEE